MPFDVLVLSAFERGDWLAGELKEKNLNVVLCDVSQLLEDSFVGDPLAFFLLLVLKLLR